MRYRIPPFVYHLLIWLAYVTVSLVTNLSQQLEDHTIEVLIYKYLAFYGVNALLFYGHYSFAAPRLLMNKRLWLFLAFLLFSFVGFGLLHYGLYWFNSHYVLDRESVQALSIPIFISYFSSAFIYVVAAIAIRYAVDHFQARQKAQQLEKEKTQAELNFLKAQVNPHFLFNAFNSLYAISRKYDKELSEAIRKLSDLMRYVLDYSQLEKATLQEEVQMIEDYLEVQNVRLFDQFDLQFQKNGEVSHVEVIPLILLPIVENAFKHGDLSLDGFIHLELTVKDNRVTFTTRNKIEARKKGDGEGLKNLEKRLALQYEQGYQLTTKMENGIYTTHLEIPVYET